jgi:thiamine biosynthesis protein ThiS
MLSRLSSPPGLNHNSQRRGRRLTIVLNGSEASTDEGCAITQLVRSLGLKPDRLAVELNSRIIRRADWDSTILAEGDHVEIVHFVGGGED